MKRRSNNLSRRRQTGVALITAILLVAIATMLAAKLSWDNQLNMRRTETSLQKEQAQMFALGAEAVAIDLLRNDDNEFDYRCDGWAFQTIYECENAFPLVQEIGIDEKVMGQMEGRIYDMQGRLNINNLIPDPEAEPVPEVREMFERLFNNLAVDQAVLDAIIDWIDADTVPTNQGAEDGTYTALDPPYRPANTYITSLSELRAVNGITDEVYTVLEPHLSALHPSWCGEGITPININFATAEVMAALHQDLNIAQTDVWAEEAKISGWESIDEISGLPADLNRQYITVRSDCVVLNVNVSVGSTLLSMYSLLDRTGGEGIFTRSRAFGLE
jgi:general secretion pathway protein K